VSVCQFTPHNASSGQHTTPVVCLLTLNGGSDTGKQVSWWVYEDESASGFTQGLEDVSTILACDQYICHYMCMSMRCHSTVRSQMLCINNFLGGPITFLKIDRLLALTLAGLGSKRFLPAADYNYKMNNPDWLNYKAFVNGRYQ
jgi:hypothetical protein